MIYKFIKNGGWFLFMVLFDREMFVGVLLMLFILMDKFFIRDRGGELLFVYFIWICVIGVSL